MAEKSDRDEGQQARGDHSPDIRASDSERDTVVARLNEAVGEGWLTLQEFSDRTDEVYVARTRGELAPLTADLPAMQPVRAPSRTRRVMLGLMMFGGSKRSGPEASKRTSPPSRCWANRRTDDLPVVFVAEGYDLRVLPSASLQMLRPSPSGWQQPARPGRLPQR
jgi:Domain of unknown function (DUF1707)